MKRKTNGILFLMIIVVVYLFNGYLLFSGFYNNNVLSLIFSSIAFVLTTIGLVVRVVDSVTAPGK